MILTPHVFELINNPWECMATFGWTDCPIDSAFSPFFKFFKKELIKDLLEITINESEDLWNTYSRNGWPLFNNHENFCYNLGNDIPYPLLNLISIMLFNKWSIIPLEQWNPFKINYNDLKFIVEKCLLFHEIDRYEYNYVVDVDAIPRKFWGKTKIQIPYMCMADIDCIGGQWWNINNSIIKIKNLYIKNSKNKGKSNRIPIFHRLMLYDELKNNENPNLYII